MDLDLLLQLAKNGIVIGLLYGLIAYGLSLILATSGVFHLAHVISLVLGSYATWWTLEKGLPVPLVVGASCAVAVVFAGLVELIVYGPLRRAGSSEISQLVASLAVLTLGQAVLAVTLGSDPKAVQPGSFMEWRTIVAGVVVRSWDLLVVLAAVVVLGMLLLVQKKTYIGLALRAVGDHPELAVAKGIRVGRVHLAVMAIAAAVAGLAGSLLAVQRATSPTMGFDLLIMAVIAVIVGGVGSMNGALLAGVGLGVGESVLSYLRSAGEAHLIMFALLVLFIYLRPSGARRLVVRVA
jgi:branched-chain amino acid transport system permease protein